jgi:predicted HicB family RNase H-like nuclease
MMKYKEYEAIVEFDETAEIFHGEVINIRDAIAFQGRSVEELKQAFADSVEDYLDFCRERGEEPDQPFSDKFMVRIDPTLHKKIVAQAKKEGQSLNSLVEKSLSLYVS